MSDRSERLQGIFNDLAERRRERLGGRVPAVVLEPLLVIDGAGWAPPIGSIGNLAIYDDDFEIGTAGGQSRVPLSEITEVRVDGQGVTTGGGFIGGGFGVKGATEGMLVASVLNALTTKRRQWVTIALGSPSGWVEVRLENFDLVIVRQALRVLADRAVANLQARSAHPVAEADVAPSDDLVTKLERLARLKDSGALTDVQFDAAKDRLLRE